MGAAQRPVMTDESGLAQAVLGQGVDDGGGAEVYPSVSLSNDCPPRPCAAGTAHNSLSWPPFRSRTPLGHTVQIRHRRVTRRG